MLFFPYGTDAPVYHYPISTGTIIAINVATYFFTTWQVLSGDVPMEDLTWLMLEFNQINPLQWLTHSFMHFNPFDLLVNMLFLWSFGLVIEGKIGSFWFTLIYLAVQVVNGALAQILFYSLSFPFPMFAQELAMGSHNGIFALMAMALMWAPENEMSCVLLILSPRLGKMGGGATGELKIVTLATGYFFIELILLVMLPLIILQALFHVLSMVMGVVLALYLLRREKVDCEDWDIISRNEWLHDYYWLCSPQRRERLRDKEDEDHDPVSMALATSSSGEISHSSYMAARSGTMSRGLKRADANPSKKKPQPTSGSAASPKDAASTKDSAETIQVPGSASAKAKRLNPLRRNTEGDPGVVVKIPSRQSKAQAHPEFNRISLLLRQAIGTNSRMMAEQHFGKLMQLGIAEGLSDKTLMDYVKLLAAHKQWLPALRPLQVIVSHGGPMADEARIRIAQVQIKIMHQPAEAAKTLRKIQFSAESMTESQKKLLTQRNQLLAQCGVRPPPLVAKPPPPN